jgi:excisionase family DNA binding protein
MRTARGNSDLLRVEQAADFLNVKPSTIRAWLLKRKLPKVRVGERCVRIPREALEKLVVENTVPMREARR